MNFFTYHDHQQLGGEEKPKVRLLASQKCFGLNFGAVFIVDKGLVNCW